MTPLRILYVATKPVYPPTDGGKLLMWNTLAEISRLGHTVTFVAPDLKANATQNEQLDLENCRCRLVNCKPGRLLPSLVRAMATGKPLSVLRHTHRAVQHEVQNELDRSQHDVIHAEQVQSVFNVPRGIPLPPVVLRAQNVESHLWRMVARARPGLAWIARREAKKMSATEARAVLASTMTVALTRRDSWALAGGDGPIAKNIVHIPPPFPSRLPGNDESVPGEPAVLLLGGGWLPNRDSISWFFDAIWSSVVEATPGAHAHVYGDKQGANSQSITWHPSPDESRKLFHCNSILAVPLRVASGIRMKILEAWSRRTPVVATPEAVEGLEARDGDSIVLASSANEFAAAISRIHLEEGFREKLVEGGGRMLSEHYEPRRTTSRLVEAYRDAIERSASD